MSTPRTAGDWALWLGRSALRANGALLIPLTALIACAPMLFHGNSCGHDFDFHLVSWMEARRAWSEGVLYPRWAESPNWAAGEPRFIFYPPLTWFLGAALSYLMAWDYVPIALTLLCLTAAGLATRSLANEFLSGPNATLAGVLAAATPYAFFTAYERSAFAELAATVWVPLLILFWMRAGRTPSVRFSKSGNASRVAFTPVASVALVLALSWLTNAPAGVMTSYLLAFLAVITAIHDRSWRPLLRATIAAAVGLGLAAFYLVPAAWEQRWIAIQQAVDVGMRVSDSWLFARHPNPDLQLHDQVLLYASLILTVTAIAAALGFFIARWRGNLTRSSRRYWLPVALLVPGIFLLQFSISAPIWTHLPKLEFLQFPWRWLMVLAIPYSLFIAAALPLATRRDRLIATLGSAIVLIALAFTASHFYFQYCDDEDNPQAQSAIFQAATGVEGTDEYAPVGNDNSLVATGLPDACLVEDPQLELGESDSGTTPDWFAEQGSCDDTFSAQLWQDQHKKLAIDSDHRGYLILRLRRYPAWSVTVNGKPAAPRPLREDGLMTIPIAEGAQTVEITWSTTPDIRWGRTISGVAALLLLLLWLLERAHAARQYAVRLSS